MARLTQQQWEQARAEYEVSGKSLSHIAKSFGVDVAAVHRKSKKEQWEQGKSQSLVTEKVAAIKALKEVKDKSQSLPLTFQKVIDREVASQVEFDEALLALECKIVRKTSAMVDSATELAHMETASRVCRNVSGKASNQTTVNVSQQQAQGQHVSPAEAIRQILEQD